MYSESDFELFARKLRSSALDKAQKLLEEAKKSAEKVLEAAKSDASRIEFEHVEQLEREIKSYEEEERGKIEAKMARERQRFLSRIKSELLEEIKARFEDRFEESAILFLKWLQKHFDEGDLYIYEGIRAEGIEKFKVEKVGEKRILFTKGNIVMEFTPKKLMDEYSELIEEEIAKEFSGVFSQFEEQ